MGKLSLSCWSSFVENSKPYFAMISLQFGYAGMNIISKVSLSRGMSHYVLVVYRHAFATASIAPFAFFFERREQPKITLKNQALKTYMNHQLTLTTLVCFMGTLQAIAVTVVAEHKASVWRIGWDMNLLAAAYAGIVTSSISYYVQGLVMKKRGPVFATAFSPLMMIINNRIHLDILWGKHKENLETKSADDDAHKLPQAIKLSSQPNNNNNNNNNLNLEPNKLSNSLIISMPDPESPIKPNQNP
ncbi:WAT1-related protein, partial [Cucurbita argyrosperma subsp. argyrosperma]